MVTHVRPADCSRCEKVNGCISADGHRRDGAPQISSRHIPRTELKTKASVSFRKSSQPWYLSRKSAHDTPFVAVEAPLANEERKQDEVHRAPKQEKPNGAVTHWKKPVRRSRNCSASSPWNRQCGDLAPKHGDVQPGALFLIPIHDQPIAYKHTHAAANRYRNDAEPRREQDGSGDVHHREGKIYDAPEVIVVLDLQNR